MLKIVDGLYVFGCTNRVYLWSNLFIDCIHVTPNHVHVMPIHIRSYIDGTLACWSRGCRVYHLADASLSKGTLPCSRPSSCINGAIVWQNLSICTYKVAESPGGSDLGAPAGMCLAGYIAMIEQMAATGFACVCLFVLCAHVHASTASSVQFNLFVIMYSHSYHSLNILREKIYLFSTIMQFSYLQKAYSACW